MRTLNSSMIALNAPLYLTPEEMKYPKMVIKNYFTTAYLDETRQVLLEVFQKVILCHDDDLGSFSRSDIFFYQREIKKLFEAACMIYQPSELPKLNLTRILNSSVIALNTPLYLDEDEMSNPENVLRNYFKTIDLDETRLIMNEAFEIALCCDDADLGYFSRQELFFFQNEILRFVEASCLVYQQK